jgi:hypothetical protein
MLIFLLGWIFLPLFAVVLGELDVLTTDVRYGVAW